MLEDLKDCNVSRVYHAGELIAEEGVEAPSASSAQRRAQSMLGKKAGAIAFSRTGDPAIGEFADAIILGRYGDVPGDLAVLMDGE